MIHRLLARLIPGSDRPRKARVYGPADQPLRRNQLSRGALEVTRKLQDAGFKAYIVGGAVRDLLFGIEPKDFDVATDARPEQEAALPACVLMAAALACPCARRSNDRHVPRGAGRRRGRRAWAPLSDNVYGAHAEDAGAAISRSTRSISTRPRRSGIVGVADLRAPPEADRAAGHRYREDPVWMLQPYGSPPSPASRSSRRRPRRSRNSRHYRNVPPARLFDEMQKLLVRPCRRDGEEPRAHGLAHGLLLARRDRRAAARPALHRARARRH
jgi:poly(A) polymerase